MAFVRVSSLGVAFDQEAQIGERLGIFANGFRERVQQGALRFGYPDHQKARECKASTLQQYLERVNYWCGVHEETRKGGAPIRSSTRRN